MPKYTILLIDYDPRNIEQISRPLTEAGYAIETAADGIAGIERFHEVRPALTLIEAMIPKKHGFEVCQQLKNSKHGRSSAIVIMTAVYKGRKYRQDAFHLYGCDEYLEKPFTDEKLLEVARKFCPAGAESDQEAEPPARDAQAPGAEPPDAPVKRPAKGRSTPAPGAAAPLATRSGPAEAEILERLNAIMSRKKTAPAPAAPKAPASSRPSRMISLAQLADEISREVESQVEEEARAGAGEAAEDAGAADNVDVELDAALGEAIGTRSPSSDDAGPSAEAAPDREPETYDPDLAEVAAEALADVEADTWFGPEGPAERGASAAPDGAEATGLDPEFVVREEDTETPRAAPEGTFAIGSSVSTGREDDDTSAASEGSGRAGLPMWIWAVAAIGVIAGIAGFVTMRKPAEPVGQDRGAELLSAVTPGSGAATAAPETARGGNPPTATPARPDDRPATPAPRGTVATRRPEPGARKKTPPEPATIKEPASRPAPRPTPTAESSPPATPVAEPVSRPSAPVESRPAAASPGSPAPATAAPEPSRPSAPPPEPAVSKPEPFRAAPTIEPSPVTRGEDTPPASPERDAPPPAAADPEPSRTAPSAPPAVAPEAADAEPEPEIPRYWTGMLLDLDEVDTPPAQIRRDAPDYPAAAERQQERVTVTVRVLVDYTGGVLEARVIQGASADLDRAALDAVRRWTYSPATKNDLPVKVWIVEKVTFEP